MDNVIKGWRAIPGIDQKASRYLCSGWVKRDGIKPDIGPRPLEQHSGCRSRGAEGDPYETERNPQRRQPACRPGKPISIQELEYPDDPEAQKGPLSRLRGEVFRRRRYSLSPVATVDLSVGLQWPG